MTTGIEIVLTCSTDCGNKVTVQWPESEYASLHDGFIEIEVEDALHELDFKDASTISLDGGVNFEPAGWKAIKGMIYCPECVNSVT